jgi:RimJ/RimL family protein N-acetyltransferase
VNPPEEIDLPDVGARLRRHRPADLDPLQAAIEESRDHLRPWMPWADQSRDDTATFLRGAIERWDAGEEFGYLIEDGADRDVLGGGGLHRRLGPDAVEIGYWRRASAGGRGLVTALARALTDVAFTMTDVNRVEIHCDEANTASAAIPRRLGYTLDRLDDRVVTAPGERGRTMIWVRRAVVAP